MPWLDALNPYNYEPALYFDPERLYTLIAQEPLAMMAVLFSFLNLCAMVTLKMSDYWWDHRKQRRQRGRLQIEAYVHHLGPDTGLEVTLTNMGGETLVIRGIGLKKPWWFGGGFEVLPVQEQGSFPLVLNARGFKQLTISVTMTSDLLKAGYRLAARDSLGSTWTLSRLATWSIRGHLTRYLKSLQVETSVSTPVVDLVESLS